MYGLYIKGRGWIKTIKNNKVICCRNFSDVHDVFNFKSKSRIADIEAYYGTILSDTHYEIQMVSGDMLIDKRVVPHKKVIYASTWNPPPFKINHEGIGYYRKYCSICSLMITPEESTCENICIHCLMALVQNVEKRYNKMDKSIIESWERAKLMDEI